jgi:hypothetical protein
MHDLDSGNLALAGEVFGGFAPGTPSSHPAGAAAAPGGGLSERQELELASELLAVRDEAELEQFIYNRVARPGIGGQRYGHAQRRRLHRIVRPPLQQFYRQHRQPRYQRYHPGLLVPVGVDAGPDPADLAPDDAAPVIATPLAAPSEQPEMELADACRAVRLATAAARRASALPPSSPSSPAGAGAPVVPPGSPFAALAAAGAGSPVAQPMYGLSGFGGASTYPAASAAGTAAAHPAAAAADPAAAGGSAERGTWTRRGRNIVLSGA